MQELAWSETVVDGPREFSAVLRQPTKRLGFYRDIAVFAFPTPAGDEPLPRPKIVAANGRVLRSAGAALDGDYTTKAQAAASVRSRVRPAGAGPFGFRAHGPAQPGLPCPIVCMG